MKRPFFCVALAYALGEVIALYTRTAGGISIATVVLICVGIFMKKYKHGKSACILGLSVSLGMVCAFLRVPQDLRGGMPACRCSVQEEAYEISTYATGAEKQGTEVTCAGILMDKMGDSWTLQVLEGEGVSGRILLRGVTDPYEISDVVQVSGPCYTFENPRNPGGFPARSYYLARNITAYYYTPRITRLSVPKRQVLGTPMYLYYGLKQRLYQFRTYAGRQIGQLLPEDTAALVSGILLGEKSEIAPEIKTLYQMGGIAHILAISGLHISLLGGCLFRLLRKLRMQVRTTGMITIVGLWLYGTMTGMSLATMRAIWMMVILLVAQIYGKAYDMPTAMGIALFIMLLCNPVRILDAGMQLSYMAIAGVSLGNYGMRRLHKKSWFRRYQKKHRIAFHIAQGFCYSAALNVMMFPVLAGTYYEVPAYAWLLNLIVVPGMTAVVAGSWIGLIASIGSVGIGKLVMLPVGWLLRGYTWLCSLTLGLPWNTIHTGELRGLQMLVWYGGIALVLGLLRTNSRNRIRDRIYKQTGRFWQKKAVVRYTVSVIVSGILAEGAAQMILLRQQRTETVYFLDVGQGDGILIRSPDGSNLVIDGGSTSQSKCGTYTLLPALRSQGMTDIDYWFVTHTDEDHISGLKEILAQGKLAQIKVRAVVFSAYVFQDEAFVELAALLQTAGIPIVWMEEEDVIGDGTFTLTCQHPTAEYHAKDKNAASLALTYHSNTFDMLFTGDMDADAIEDMDIQQSFDCIKLPHHGSKYSYVEGFYTHADYGVISCGYNNRYGHPHAEVLEGLEQEGTQILRTDEMGAVIFRGR